MMTLQDSSMQEVSGTGEMADGTEDSRLADTNKIRREIQKAFKEMEKIDGERDDINAKANEIRASMKSKGIPTAAFNAAYKRYKMDEDKREAHDFAFALCTNATGVGYQPELFDPMPGKTAH